MQIGKENLAVDENGSSNEFGFLPTQIYVKNKGSETVYFSQDGSLSELLAAVTAGTAMPLAAGDAISLDVRYSRRLNVATAAGKTSTVNFGAHG